jgi:hypothetical protein
VTFCINRDHKISFQNITLPFGEVLGLKFSLSLASFSLVLLCMAISWLLVDGSDALALEGSSLLLWWFVLAFSLNW